MKTTAWKWMWALPLVVIGGLTSTEAFAQYAKYQGQIILVQQPFPDKQDDLPRFLQKNALRSLEAEPTGDKWTFGFYAALSKDPPLDTMLVVFHEVGGGRNKLVNSDDLKIEGKQVTGKYTVHKIIGFQPGKSYQMKIILKDDRGNEHLFAKSGIFTLKAPAAARPAPRPMNP
jgi:hypothetical protein